MDGSGGNGGGPRSELDDELDSELVSPAKISYDSMVCRSVAGLCCWFVWLVMLSWLLRVVFESCDCASDDASDCALPSPHAVLLMLVSLPRNLLLIQRTQSLAKAIAN